MYLEGQRVMCLWSEDEGDGEAPRESFDDVEEHEEQTWMYSFVSMNL